MKPREFWINGHQVSRLSSEFNDNPEDWIHVREVVPIDWDKIEKELKPGDPLVRIIELVEKQLGGEE